MSPRESAKNGRNGAHGFNCIIFVNFEVEFEFFDKNWPRKKNFMLLWSFWNFSSLTTRGILAFFTVVDAFRRANFVCHTWRRSQRIQQTSFFKSGEVGRVFLRSKTIFFANFHFLSLIFSKSRKIFSFFFAFFEFSVVENLLVWSF